MATAQGTGYARSLHDTRGQKRVLGGSAVPTSLSLGPRHQGRCTEPNGSDSLSSWLPRAPWVPVSLSQLERRRASSSGVPSPSLVDPGGGLSHLLFLPRLPLIPARPRFVSRAWPLVSARGTEPLLSHGIPTSPLPAPSWLLGTQCFM